MGSTLAGRNAGLSLCIPWAEHQYATSSRWTRPSIDVLLVQWQETHLAGFANLNPVSYSVQPVHRLLLFCKHR